jgi:Acetyltransferase (GNAT) domain
MKIEILRPKFFEAYNQFLLAQESSLFYYSLKYRDFLKDLLGCEEKYLVALDGELIHGILPLMYIEQGGGRIYNSLPYYGSNGGILTNNEKAYQELVRTYNAIASEQATIASTIINNPFVQEKAEDLVHNYKDYRIAQFTPLLQTDATREFLMSRIDSSARRNVKKAVAEGVSVEIDCDQMGCLKQFHEKSFLATGRVPKGEAFFAAVPLHFTAGKDYEIYVAKREGVVIAALLLFYFNQTVEYFTPAVEESYRPVQPLPLVLITAMADAAKRGFKWWNWGGTWKSQIGVYRFKKKWAAQERDYLYCTQLNDLTLLTWEKEKILSLFPHFFIVPFSALQTVERPS